jgi:hypothetical protein
VRLWETRTISKGRNETEEDGPAPSLLKFTREDEKPLFGGNIQHLDPGFLNDFRMLYSSNDDAIPLDFRMCVFMVSVDEIENRGLYLGCRGLNEDDIWMAGCKGMKVPVVGIAPKYNKYCQSSMKDDLRLYNVEKTACIPVCTKDKCWLIANNKCIAKVHDTWASATRFTAGDTWSICANCERSYLGVGYKLLECSRCKAAWYCNVECQKAHWPKHKKRARSLLVNTVKNWKQTRNFPLVHGASKSFIAGRLSES